MLGARLAAWTLALQPGSAAEHALIERAVVASVQRQRSIIACHAQLLVALDRGDPVAALVEDGVHSLYFGYERMHDKDLRQALGGLLQGRADAVAAAPDESDAPGVAGQYGYY
jgi:hypothetical protein